MTGLAWKSLPIGAHLATPRLGYWHHGIYAGAGRVVHYAGFKRFLQRGPVEEISLTEFLGGRELRLPSTPPSRFDAAEIVARARSRLGEDDYRIASNNCEHFATWCRTGVASSPQVQAWLQACAQAWPCRIGNALRRFIHRRGAPVLAQPASPRVQGRLAAAA